MKHQSANSYPWLTSHRCMTGIAARYVCWSNARLKERVQRGSCGWKQVKSGQLSNCHTKHHQGICMWLPSYCANHNWAPGGSTWRKLFKSNKSVFILLLLSTVYWHPSILSINGCRPPQEHHGADVICVMVYISKDALEELCGSCFVLHRQIAQEILGWELMNTMEEETGWWCENFKPYSTLS